MSTVPHRPIAVVTGASSGIGRELARLCAADGHDLFLAADAGPLEEVAAELRMHGGHVETVQADLATADGVARLVAAVGARPVAVLMANAGHGLGHAFLQQDFQQVRHVIDTNITGTIDLIQQVGRGMVQRGAGRILVTGSRPAPSSAAAARASRPWRGCSCACTTPTRAR
ncbi:MAG: SDR family NAD(P)-dependent oxidoreductase [Rubrivivax sp.]|nr:MAG: SDR family NAD(P)-dependent oxidoreductase [Rubrivivax sp.]